MQDRLAPTPHPGPPPEMRHLLAILGEGAAAPAPADLDWALFEQLAEHHHVILRLPEVLAGPVPDAVRQNLAGKRRTAGLRALAMAAELGRIGAAFNSAGLSWLALKGPAFAMVLHGRPDQRSSIDLDLLVAPEAEAVAADVLRQLGYPGGARAPEHFHGGFINRGRGILAELHVRLVWDDRQFPLARFTPFERLTRVTIAGVPIPTLAMEPAIVFAAVHGTKHFWRRLIWLLDIADAARGDRVDWRGTLDLARHMGVERQLAGALFLARHRLGAPVPAEIARDARLAASGRSALSVFGRLEDSPLLSGDEEAYYRIGRFATLGQRLHQVTRLAARRSVLAEVLAPGPKDEAAFALPPILRPLQYLLRPLRILAEVSGQAMRRRDRD